MVANPLSFQAPKRVRHAVTDAALVLSILSGGCMMERPRPDDDDDDDDCGSDEACPDQGTGPDPEETETTPHASPPPPGGSSSASCCESHYGVGCADHQVESCVCGLDPKCCTDGWDATCVMTAEQFCPAACGDGDGPWG